MRASGANAEASEKDRIQIVDILVKHGADVGVKSLPITTAAGSPNPEITALAAAAQNGFPGVVSTLIAAGAKVNERFADNRTALIAAAGTSGRISDLDIVVVAKELVNAGADVNAESAIYASALNEAARTDRYELAKFLLERGVDRTSRSNSIGPLSRQRNRYIRFASSVWRFRTIGAGGCNDGYFSSCLAAPQAAECCLRGSRWAQRRNRCQDPRGYNRLGGYGSGRRLF